MRLMSGVTSASITSKCIVVYCSCQPSSLAFFRTVVVASLAVEACGSERRHGLLHATGRFVA